MMKVRRRNRRKRSDKGTRPRKEEGVGRKEEKDKERKRMGRRGKVRGGGRLA